MDFQTKTNERVNACLGRRSKLTMGEVELLYAIEGKKEVTLSQLESQELQKIERKLGLA